jgi:hypothetical protein
MQTEIQTQTETPIRIPREFLSDLEKIAEEYKEVKEMKYQAGIDLVVDLRFRRFLERQCEYLHKLARLKATRSLAVTDWDFLEAVSAFKLLVYNNKYWNEFSQKLKEGNFTEFPQIGYAS